MFYWTHVCFRTCNWTNKNYINIQRLQPQKSTYILFVSRSTESNYGTVEIITRVNISHTVVTLNQSIQTQTCSHYATTRFYFETLPDESALPNFCEYISFGKRRYWQIWTDVPPHLVTSNFPYHPIATSSITSLEWVSVTLLNRERHWNMRWNFNGEAIPLKLLQMLVGKVTLWHPTLKGISSL